MGTVCFERVGRTTGKNVPAMTFTFRSIFSAAIASFCLFGEAAAEGFDQQEFEGTLLTVARETPADFRAMSSAIERALAGQSPQSSRQTIDAALQNDGVRDDPLLRAALHRRLGYSYFGEQNDAEARRYLELAKSDLSGTQSWDALAGIDVALGIVAYRNDDFGSAVRYYREALATNNGVLSTTILSTIHNNAGVLFSALDMKDRALSHYRLAAENSRLAGFISADRANIALLLNDLGKVSEAREQIDSILADPAYFETPSNKAIAYRTAMRVYLNAGEFRKAIEFGELAAGVIDYLSDRFQVRLQCDFAKAHDGLDESSKALAYARKCYDLAVTAGQPWIVSEAARTLAHILNENQDYGQAAHIALVALENGEVHKKSLSEKQAQLVAGELALDLERSAVIVAQREKELADLRLAQQSQRSVQYAIIIAILSLFSLALAILLRDRLLKTRKLESAINLIEDQKRSLAQLANTRETLILELNHRVKNNLQVVASLLGLERRRLEQNGEPETHMRDVQARVLTMASVHEGLQTSGSSDLVSLRNYVEGLSQRLTSLHTPRCQINVDERSDDMLIAMSQAAPAGLVLCELISNSTKHGYKDDQKGDIDVSIKDGVSEIEIKVTDHGQGLPAGFSLNGSSSLGLSLVTDLVQQIEGQIFWRNIETGGVEWRLLIPPTSQCGAHAI